MGRFTDNRALYRKVYNYGLTRRPNNIDFVDSTIGITRSLDQNHMIRHRDYFYIPGLMTSSISTLIEYWEDDVWVVGSDFKSITFPLPFSNIPIITLEITGTIFANPYLISVSKAGASFGISAPISGTVRYKAINCAVYPSVVQRIPLFPNVYAKAISGIGVFSDENSNTVTFPSLSTIANEFSATTFDQAGGTEVDTYVTGTVEITSVNLELSSHMKGQVNFIGLKPIP